MILKLLAFAFANIIIKERVKIYLYLLFYNKVPLSNYLKRVTKEGTSKQRVVGC